MLSWLKDLISSYLTAILDLLSDIYNKFLDFIISILSWFLGVVEDIWKWAVDLIVWTYQEFCYVAQNTMVDLIYNFSSTLGFDVDFSTIRYFYVNVNDFFPLSEMVVAAIFLLTTWIAVKIWILSARLTLFILTLGQA